MEDLKDKLENYKAAPSPTAWKHLENKLEHRRQRSRIVKFRNLSMAAVFIAAVAIIGLMNIYVKNYNPDVFATSKHFEPIQMETLEATDDELYQRSRIRFLNNEYLKVFK
jgi:hypothetical protein